MRSWLSYLHIQQCNREKLDGLEFSVLNIKNGIKSSFRNAMQIQNSFGPIVLCTNFILN